MPATESRSEDLLYAVKAYLTARDTLADMPVQRLQVGDKHFEAVRITLETVRAVVAEIEAPHD